MPSICDTVPCEGQVHAAGGSEQDDLPQVGHARKRCLREVLEIRGVPEIQRLETRPAVQQVLREPRQGRGVEHKVTEFTEVGPVLRQLLEAAHAIVVDLPELVPFRDPLLGTTSKLRLSRS